MLVGMGRSGSTWLWECLGNHPDVFVPTWKELNYFSHSFLRGVSYAQYLDNFIPATGEPPASIRMEFSVAYSRLSGSQIRCIKRLYPKLQLILLLRHPINRAWSGAHRSLGRRKNLNNLSEWRLFLFFQLYWKHKYGESYHEIITKWSKVFGPERLLVITKDEIDADKVSVLKRICLYIGADAEIDAGVFESDREINKSKNAAISSRAIPRSVEWFLARKYLRMIKKTNTLLDGKLDAWVESLRVQSQGGCFAWHVMACSTFVVAIPRNLVFLALSRFRIIAFNLVKPGS